MFTIEELLEFKANAEKALLMAQARVTVAEELIAMANRKCQEQITVDDLSDVYGETEQVDENAVDGTL